MTTNKIHFCKETRKFFVFLLNLVNENNNYKFIMFIFAVQNIIIHPPEGTKFYKNEKT